MPGTERSGFVRAVCEQPDEDLHRTAFADWLDEHGLRLDDVIEGTRQVVRGIAQDTRAMMNDVRNIFRGLGGG